MTPAADLVVLEELFSGVVNNDIMVRSTLVEGELTPLLYNYH